VPFERKLCVFSGHVFRWFDADLTGMPASGLVSLLSVSAIKRLNKSDDELGDLDPDADPGFVLQQMGCTPVYVCGTAQAPIALWYQILYQVLLSSRRPPMSGLGPKQAAAEKPVISGRLNVRDSVDGSLLDTFSPCVVSLYDSRFECLVNDKVTEVHYFTVDFCVGDSRLKPNVFVMIDSAPHFPTSYFFEAEDWQSKRFWMQVMAKNLLNLKSMCAFFSSVFALLLLLSTTSDSP